MKKTNFTLSFLSETKQKNSKNLFRLMVALICCLTLFQVNATAQNTCALSCHGAQVSLDMECEAVVTTAMIADTSQCLDGEFEVYVMTLDGDTIPTSPTVTVAELNMQLKVSVYDTDSGNSCWSTILVQDKMKPGIICVDATIECTDLFSFAEPTATDNCSGATVQLVDEDQEALCDDEYIRSVTRYYVATDLAGNISDTCSQTLFLRRINFDLIQWPDPFSIDNNNAIACNAAFPDVDMDGNPDPLGVGGTGVPTINGNPIYPDFNFACNSATTFEDINIGPIGCVKKIMRMWTVREWHCTGERDTSFVQLIEIVDEDGPIISCPDDVELTTNYDDCTANYMIPPIAPSFDCNPDYTVTVTYPGGFKTQNGGFFVQLPVGENLITYTVYDGCLNSSECTFTVNVMDDTPPVPVCDEHTVVSLTGYEIGGLTTVPAAVFDDGSYDECGDVTFVARRMNSCIDFDWTTNGAGEDADPDGLFTSRDLGIVNRTRVPFACCDAASGQPIMIILTVTDESLNSNTCMVEVTVQDKIKPTITCPTDITVSCEFPYDEDNLSVFGVIRELPESPGQYCVNDPGNPDADNNGFVCGTEGLAVDNCSVDLNEDKIVNINNCGTGVITRTFIAIDPNGSSSCNQRIYFKNFDPIQTQDIRWPLDYENAECGAGTDPEDLPPLFSFPVITEDECDLVGVNYEDQVFPFVEGACFKILRTWQVIEWCLYEELGGLVPGRNYWTHQQIIKVTNEFGPEFTTSQPNIEVCNDFDCGGLFVELIQSAGDDCTPDDELVWSWALDANNDNSINDTDSGTGNTIDASDVYPIGTHRIIFSFEDKCGNKTTREQLFTINSCKAPQPICINGLSTDLMPVDANNDGEVDGGMIVIWAKDFDKGSMHPCGLGVTVSFSENPADSSRTFDCSHAGQQVPVRLYAHDSNGRFAFCETYIIIQDNMNACGGTGGGLATISGEVMTENTLEVAEVEMTLDGSGMLPVVTNGSGHYAFPQMPLGGTYEVSPMRDGDDKNGVSTLDLVRIQKHLLGIESFTSPYEMIAADANNSESVSAIDLIELRKLILGIYEELPSNTSWRFIDEGYAFPDPFNPWFEAFPESYILTELNQDMIDVDFVGVKIGDLNNTVVANASQVVIRSAQTMTFGAENQNVKAGEQFTVQLHADQFDEIQAFQFTLNFDPTAIEFRGHQSGAITIGEEAFGLNRLAEGQMTMSWFDVDAVSQSIEDVLFELTFIAKRDISLDQIMRIGSDVTAAEAYNASNESMDIVLEFKGAGHSDEHFELMQNRPNPFNGSTTISFMLPSDAPATLTVFDLSGKQIRTVEMAGVKGYNEITLNQNQIGVSGVLYYQLTSEGYLATRKMVVLK